MATASDQWIFGPKTKALAPSGEMTYSAQRFHLYVSETCVGMPSKPQLYLAPFQGVTNELYRTTYHTLFPGIDKYFAPFIKVQLKGDLTRKRTRSILPTWDPKIPLVPQILSNEGDEFFVFDEYVQSLGYQEFNWNLGCPVPMVTTKKRGSGLLPDSERIQRILEQVMGKLKCRLSIKTRLGLSSPDELLALMPILNQYPIHELIIHPRLGRQMYAGHVDLAAFAKCVQLSRIPVVYNGDVFNAQTWTRLQTQFPQVQHWMLGRGVLVNPFLPAQIKQLNSIPRDKVSVFRHFHAEYVRQYEVVLFGPRHLLDKLKEFWFYAHHFFIDGSDVYRRLKKLTSMDDYHSTVNRFLDQSPEVVEHLELKSEDFK